MLVFLIITVVVVGVILAASYICYKMAFFAPDRNPNAPVEIVPAGKEYEPFRDSMLAWAKETAETPHREYSITSFDGLTLYGRYYECKAGAPIELMFHGYRGNAIRDLSGGMQRCFALSHNAFIVDQRCSGKSGGNVICFGINERRDCLSWIDFIIKELGADTKIILCGISMGAATVLMAAGEELPSNVIGVLADCGYNSARDIICSVIKKLHLPPNLCYPFVRLSARLFGHFDLEETSPQEAIAKCKIPVIFFHGEADNFVPAHMSKTNFDACTAKKRLVTVPDAAHGLSYLVDPDTYLRELKQFFN